MTVCMYRDIHTLQPYIIECWHLTLFSLVHRWSGFGETRFHFLRGRI